MSERSLVDQPNWLPSRKLTAMIIAFCVTNIVKGLLEQQFPGADFTDFLLQFNTMIDGIITFGVGYFVRNRSVV